MRNRIVRLGVLFASVLSLVGVMSPPAHATKVTTVTFTGTATLDNGFGSPGLNGTPTVTTTTKTGKKGLPTVENTVGGGNDAAFGFSETTCVASSTSSKGPKLDGTTKPPEETSTSCTIRATGAVSGFCGLSSGTGTATAAAGSQTYTVPTFKFWSTPGGLKVTSNQDNAFKTNPAGTVTATGGQFNAFVTAAPPNPTNTVGESCTNKTARTFRITGEANITFKNI